VDAAGTVIYKDLTLQFDVDGSGSFTLSSGFPLIADSPSLLASSIVTGDYAGPSNVNSGKNLITITGPAIVQGGVLAYTITLSSGASGFTYPAGGIFYVGSIDTIPLADRLKKAGVTSTAWSYGTIATGTCQITNWCSTGLIGVSQVGNTLTFVSFNGRQGDQITPVDQIVYTLLPPGHK
jgi:hypothetical protein